MKELILGGVRSGKSRLAEKLAKASGLAVTCIATARVGDEAMRQRVEEHRRRRSGEWGLVEEPLALAGTLRQHAEEKRCLIVDCLTLWLTQLLCETDVNRLRQERDELLETLPHLPGHIILIGNETNMGVLPMGELSRLYCDEAGRLHQELAGLCDRVILMVAGLPWMLKEVT
jgi:adenosylcobinamide kinase/adenosylcobinamide-phosphate guanylyltransferase